MIFQKKYAGKWIASKGANIVASGPKLEGVMKKVETRKDLKEIRYDLVPKARHFAGSCGVFLY